MKQSVNNKNKKRRPVTSITSFKKQITKDEEESNGKRPHTSLRPIKRNFPITNPNDNTLVNPLLKNEEKNYNKKNSQNLNIESNKNFRLTRSSSSYRDKEFNKYWQPDKTNTLSINTFKIQQNRPVTGISNLNSNLTHSQLQAELNQNRNDLIDSDFDVLNRNLYKISKIDWEAKRNFQFLTSIGGSELSIGNFCENSNLSTEFSDRPYSAYNNVQNISFNNKVIKRPHTGQIPQNTINNRIFSGIYKDVKNNTSSTSDNINKLNQRPMTAVNKNNLRLLSARIPSAHNKSTFNDYVIASVPNKKKETDSVIINNDILPINEMIEESISESKSKRNQLQNESSELSTLCNRQKNCPKVDSLIRNYKKLDIKNYSIKIQAADSDILDIFDRSQRTTAATLSKVGDFEYYTAHQRIGSFMSFSAQLTREDLRKLEMFFHYNDSQVSYLTSNKNFNHLMKKKKLTIEIQHSLFHGNMRKEYKKDRHLIKSKRVYDPSEFLKNFVNSNLYDPSTWSEEFAKKIKTSLSNYEKYLNSDKIQKSDIFSFDKNLSKRFLTNMDKKFLIGKKNLLDEIFLEIEEDYFSILKKILLDYVLRSPFERKRLNIQWYPRKAMTSSEIIAEYGSFNRTLYREWVGNYTSAVENLSNHFTLFSIISSAICDWTQSFRHVNLFYIEKLKKMILIPYGTLHINEFYNIQTSYMKKCSHFFKDIFYRGVLLIIRKNKMFKRKLITEGKWTFKGFLTKKNNDDFVKLADITSENESSSNNLNKIENSINSINSLNTSDVIFEKYDDDYLGMEYTDEIEDFWSYVKIDDLIDIRVNPSYFAFTTLIQKKAIDLKEYIYDKLTIDQRINMNNSITTCITIFLRQIIEKSMRQFSDFLISFPLISKIMENYPDDSMASNPPRNSFHLNIHSKLAEKHLNQNSQNHSQISHSHISGQNFNATLYDLNSEIHYKEKEIRLPNLKAFMVKDNLKPILNLKSKYDQTFNQIRLEYTSEEIIEIFMKLFENCVTFFNSLYMTHFLEFKQIPPTESEKINKQHWIRLNEVFLESKLEINKAKTFLEDYYANVCPNIIVEETKINDLKATLRVAFTNEEFFVKIKNNLVSHVRDHYLETEEFQKIFEPLRDIIINSISDSIKSFLDSNNIIDYGKYKTFIEKLRTLLRYLNTIPNYIKFSLFSIDIIETKKELLKKTQDLLDSLFMKLENLIFAHYNAASDLFFAIHKQINKRLTTPEELVEMEKIKTNLSSDLALIDKELENATKIYYFLIAEDHILSANLISRHQEILIKNKKFQKDLNE